MFSRVFVQRSSGERDGVERFAAGPARHAAERLHLPQTGDVSPGTGAAKNIARNNQLST